MFKLDLEKAEEPKIKFPTSVRTYENKRIPEKRLFLLHWGCTDAGGPTGATPHSRSGGATSSKVRRSSCALLELLHVQGKRNTSKTVGVARGHQRADTLKP